MDGRAVIDFTLTEEQQALRDMAGRVADERWADKALEWDRDATFLPDADRTALAELGLLGIAIP